MRFAAMKSLFKAFLRYLAEVAASEAGELLSARRKAHLLEAERYSRLGPEPKQKAATAAQGTASRCTGSTRRTRDRLRANAILLD
jgi:hypothetical protein